MDRRQFFAIAAATSLARSGPLAAQPAGKTYRVALLAAFAAVCPHRTPDLLVRPKVGTFRALDFM